MNQRLGPRCAAAPQELQHTIADKILSPAASAVSPIPSPHLPQPRQRQACTSNVYSHPSPPPFFYIYLVAPRPSPPNKKGRLPKTGRCRATSLVKTTKRAAGTRKDLRWQVKSLLTTHSFQSSPTSSPPINQPARTNRGLLETLKLMLNTLCVWGTGLFIKSFVEPLGKVVATARA